MAYWLYQMSVKVYKHENYRRAVWEGSITSDFDLGQVNPRGREPQPGDTVVFFYAESGALEPGIYGWGIVLDCLAELMSFRAAAPSDYLKMNPLWDKDIDQKINAIRGKMAQGTLWELDINQFDGLKKRIGQFVYGSPHP